MSDYNKIRDIRIGLEIFERRGGRQADAQHDALHAMQGEGQALTPDEVAALLSAGWRLECKGCARDGEPGAICHPSKWDDPRWHYLTCAEWYILT